MGYQGAGGTVVFDFEGSLDLARALWRLADEVESQDRAREGEFETAKKKWRGAYGDQFVVRRDEERTSVRTVIEGLRTDARSWAKAWADAKFQQRKNDRVAEIEEIRANRGFVERTYDTITRHDDSEDQVAPAVPVSPPQPPTFTPTC